MLIAMLVLVGAAPPAPELELSVRDPAALMPQLLPWLRWAGEVAPGLHPVSLERSFRGSGFDPLDPSGWPEPAAHRPWAWRGSLRGFTALLSEGPTLEWRSALAPRGPLKGPGDLVIATALPELGRVEGGILVGSQTLRSDLRVNPPPAAPVRAYVGRRGARPLFQVSDPVLEAVGEAVPEVLARHLGLPQGGELAGPFHLALMPDGSLWLALTPARGRISALEEALSGLRIQNRRLGESVLVGWPGGPESWAQVGPARRGNTKGALRIDVTPHRLLASLERRSRLEGPRLGGGAVAMATLAYGRALSTLSRMSWVLDRRGAGLRVQGVVGRL